MWKPRWEYERTDYHGQQKTKIPSAMVLEDQPLYECPVSFIEPKSAELARLYNQAKRQGTTLSKLLGDKSAYIEEVEEVFHEAKMMVKLGWDKEREKHRG